ncbi:ATP-dependent helicase [archaeon]|nr:ATP-dependent helicase [archaeon]
MIEYKTKKDSEKDIYELLHPLVKKWFKSKFKSFADAQRFAVTEVHARNNILVSSPTGSGKTLTSFLSILNELVDSSEKGILEDKVYCVYISPLKALNNDIFENLIKPLHEMEKIAGKDLGIRVAVRTGDTTASAKQKMLRNPPHILVTTPESLAIVLSATKFRENLKKVEWGIIDEIHSLVENKRGVHLSLSFERLQRLSEGMCRIGLSATVAPIKEVAEYLVGRRNCKIVDVQHLKKVDLQVMSPVNDLVNNTFERITKKTYELINKLIQEHKTTLVFTNTRSATERVVHHLKEKFPENYYEIVDKKPNKESALIGAHHSSLSKEHRFEMEQRLREGKMRAIVCSTSLELGIDIGSIDLVICLGSPKSVSRALQRVGRSGHALDQVAKGRFIVLDRDDLVECSVLLKHAIEKKIDRVHIPTNCLDVLAQQVLGMALEQVWEVKKLYKVVRKSYCYKNLTRQDFNDVLDYLAGNFISLEERYIYARIWWDKEEGKIGKKGRMTRVIYMTNIGTIPDSQGIIVKFKGNKIGVVEEGFLEKLKRGDIFVLGGNTYQFNFARGMVAEVTPVSGKRPTVPAWYSERLPLSYDLGYGILEFRKLMDEKFRKKVSKKMILKFIHKYLYVDSVAAEASYNYFKDQYDYIGVPHSKKLYIEHYSDEMGKKYAVFHFLFGRRVNDALSRVLGYAILGTHHKDVEVGINDNGFYVSHDKKINVMEAFKLVKSKDFIKGLENAVDKSEVLKRRFRHCAGRSLMILRNYAGKRKRVGRQQVSSMILLSAVRRISNDFFILKEARREVIEDLMDVHNAYEILKKIESKDIKIKEVVTNIPSPFALNLVLQGYSDILKMEDKQDFLKRMHQMVKAKIALKQHF